ncbi:MAG: cytochrome c biogenesis protein CcdA [Rhizobiales bacterium]|nr:cytochrome c biogenesis protein CcdA [Hyphomicrobiales bacterium]
MDATFGAAFIAGLLSFVSPCVLPIVPPYLAFLAGLSAEEMTGPGSSSGPSRRIMGAAIAFVLGFTTVFVLLGATASALGQALVDHMDTLAVIAGAIILLFGLHFLGLLRIGLFYREARVHIARKPPGLIGAYLIGLAFAFGWTPCAGPVLAAIVFVAGAEETALRGAALLATYSLGIGIPFLVAAAFTGPFMRWSKGMRRHLGTIEKVSGALLVVTGLLFMTGQMKTIAYWLLEAFPGLGTFG